MQSRVVNAAKRGLARIEIDWSVFRLFALPPQFGQPTEWAHRSTVFPPNLALAPFSGLRWTQDQRTVAADPLRLGLDPDLTEEALRLGLDTIITPYIDAIAPILEEEFGPLSTRLALSQVEKVTDAAIDYISDTYSAVADSSKRAQHLTTSGGGESNISIYQQISRLAFYSYDAYAEIPLSNGATGLDSTDILAYGYALSHSDYRWWADNPEWAYRERSEDNQDYVKIQEGFGQPETVANTVDPTLYLSVDFANTAYAWTTSVADTYIGDPGSIPNVAKLRKSIASWNSYLDFLDDVAPTHSVARLFEGVRIFIRGLVEVDNGLISLLPSAAFGCRSPVGDLSVEVLTQFCSSLQQEYFADLAETNSSSSEQRVPLDVPDLVGCLFRQALTDAYVAQMSTLYGHSMSCLYDLFPWTRARTDLDQLFGELIPSGYSRSTSSYDIFTGDVSMNGTLKLTAAEGSIFVREGMLISGNSSLSQLLGAIAEQVSERGSMGDFASLFLPGSPGSAIRTWHQRVRRLSFHDSPHALLLDIQPSAWE